MNICLAIVTDAWAGAETVVHELARHLRARGENVSILINQEGFKYYVDLEDVKILNCGSFFRTTELIRSCISPKIETQAEDESPDSYRGSFYLNALLREIYFKRARTGLMQSILDNKFDVIHSNLNAGIVFVSNLTTSLGIPIIATLHGQSVAGMRKRSCSGWLTSPVASWRRERLNKALEKADKVTAVSQAEISIVENCDIPLKGRAVVIPNGVNVTEIQSFSSSVMPLKGKFNLLFPGGAKFVKGGDLVIEALSKVKIETSGMHIYMAGDVPRSHYLHKLVAANGLDEQVTFTGFLGIREYRRLLNSVDLVVMPSREESFGIVFLEAMALGKPVIGGDTGGIPEVVRNGRNGILVKPEPEQIAEAIIRLYRNKDLRQEMSQNNLTDVAYFDWTNIVQQYINLYKSVSRR